jgi:hypothetical protein
MPTDEHTVADVFKGTTVALMGAALANAQVFYKDESDPRAAQLAPDPDGLIWMPDEGFANTFAQNATLIRSRCPKLSRGLSRFKSIQEPSLDRRGDQNLTGVFSPKRTA